MLGSERVYLCVWAASTTLQRLALRRASRRSTTFRVLGLLCAFVRHPKEDPGLSQDKHTTDAPNPPIRPRRRLFPCAKHSFRP